MILVFIFLNTQTRTHGEFTLISRRIKTQQKNKTRNNLKSARFKLQTKKLQNFVSFRRHGLMDWR